MRYRNPATSYEIFPLSSRSQGHDCNEELRLVSIAYALVEVKDSRKFFRLSEFSFCLHFICKCGKIKIK